MKKSKQKETQNNKNPLMAVSIAALNLADYLTTRRILNTGGEEHNPVADFLIKKNCFGIYKAATTLVCTKIIYEDKMPKVFSKMLLGFCGASVVNNVKEIWCFEREKRKGDVQYNGG